MMADLDRIKRNVAKMAGMNAPEADIDGYIASEGVTVEDVRNHRMATPGNAPSSPAYDSALASASAKSRMFADGPRQFGAGVPQPSRPDLAGATAATLSGIVNGIPVIGPMVQNASDALVGAGAALTGGDYGETVAGLQARRAELANANPIANVAGSLAGGIGSYTALGATANGARALGIAPGMNLGARMGNGAASGAAISAADSWAKGNSPEQMLSDAAYGGAGGFITPPIASAVSGAAKAIGNRVAPMIGAMTDAAGEASRRTGVAFLRDAKAMPGSVMNATDEAAARAGGVPLMNVDRGGETTRALARSVANQSPEARGIITKAADERFETQGLRAIDFIKRIGGGAVDDLGYQKAIKDTARIVNKPRYDAAFNSPRAQQVFTVDTQELMQSPAVQKAISMTQSRGKDLAAIEGHVPVANPFRQGRDGIWRVVQKADGTFAVPNLRFWDQVKRNLDGMIGAARRGGDETEVGILSEIKNKLVGSLDQAVPSYRAARQGAASFFDAEDALDAGRKFANAPRNVPEARAAFNSFTDAEKAAFKTGYASELIDRIRATGDKTNVINQVFGNQARREMIELVFGKHRARELEAYIRVENLADKIRGALGNSTTARQLLELGIGGGIGGIGGFSLSGGDLGAAAQGAALGFGAGAIRRGGKAIGQRADAEVLQHVAKLLTSSNPADLQKAIANASLSPKWMQAINQLEAALQIGQRATLPMVVGQ